jgi:hypothetical protein
MKAFVSYSVTDNNEFILTLLSSKLREKNFIVTTSQNFYSNIIDYNTMSEIGTAHLFVGIITGTGTERNRVLEEWNYAVQRNVPNLLLIEDTVSVHQQFTGNYIRFNRSSPQAAINEINRRMTPSQPATSKSSDDIVPWILGGAALLAIIGLLTSKDK